MFSNVNASRCARKTLNYNERKLQENKALLIAAFNYWQDGDTLDREDKLRRIRDLNIRNERSEARTVHISLNFHPGDTLSDRKMRIIAADFLRQIDFAQQPALVYRHLDAGHPHMHIVSTNIRSDGSRISNDLRAPHILMRICNTLEQKHHLTPVTYKRPHQRLQGLSVPAAKVGYGREATKTGIERVLQYVLPDFVYTSLDRLNALLRNYNIMADPGSPGSSIHRHKGLFYRALDDNGKRVGAPIKASALNSKPTLQYLEQRFIRNQQLLSANLVSIRSPLDWALEDGPENLEELGINLEINEGMKLMQSPQGLYFIRWRTRTVCKDEDLGLRYTALSIERELSLHRDPRQKKLMEEQAQEQSLGHGLARR